MHFKLLSLKLSPPPCNESYVVELEKDPAINLFFLNQRARHLSQMNNNPKIGYMTNETAQAYCGFPHTGIARMQFEQKIQQIGGSCEGTIIKFDLKKSERTASELLDQLLQLDFVFLDCNGAMCLATLLAYRDAVGVHGFNRYFSANGISTISIGGGKTDLPYTSQLLCNPEGLDIKDLPDCTHSYVYIKGCKSYTEFHRYSSLQGYCALLTKKGDDVKITAFQSTAPTQDYTVLLDQLKCGQTQTLSYAELARLLPIQINGLAEAPDEDVEIPKHYSSIFIENGDTRTVEMIPKIMKLACADPSGDSEFRVPKHFRDENPIGITDFEELIGIIRIRTQPTIVHKTSKQRKIETES